MFLIEETSSGDFVLTDEKTVRQFSITAVINPTVAGPLLTLEHSVRNGPIQSVVIPTEDVASMARILMPGSPPVTFSNNMLKYRIVWINGVLVIIQRLNNQIIDSIVIHPALTSKVCSMVREADELMSLM